MMRPFLLGTYRAGFVMFVTGNGLLILTGWLYDWDYARGLYAFVIGTVAWHWAVFIAVLVGLARAYVEKSNAKRQALTAMMSRADAEILPPERRMPLRVQKSGVYGKADAAFDSDIDRALSDIKTGLEPMFEE